MSDLVIRGSGAGQGLPQINSNKDAKGKEFGDLLQDAISKVSDVQNEAEKAIKELGSGGDITNAIIAMEKADMSFQVMLEVRNKLLTAYEEVMRMQV